MSTADWHDFANQILPPQARRMLLSEHVVLTVRCIAEDACLGNGEPTLGEVRRAMGISREDYGKEVSPRTGCSFLELRMRVFSSLARWMEAKLMVSHSSARVLLGLKPSVKAAFYRRVRMAPPIAPPAPWDDKVKLRSCNPRNLIPSEFSTSIGRGA